MKSCPGHEATRFAVRPHIVMSSTLNRCTRVRCTFVRAIRGATPDTSGSCTPIRRSEPWRVALSAVACRPAFGRPATTCGPSGERMADMGPRALDRFRGLREADRVRPRLEHHQQGRVELFQVNSAYGPSKLFGICENRAFPRVPCGRHVTGETNASAPRSSIERQVRRPLDRLLWPSASRRSGCAGQ